MSKAHTAALTYRLLNHMVGQAGSSRSRVAGHCVSVGRWWSQHPAPDRQHGPLRWRMSIEPAPAKNQTYRAASHDTDSGGLSGADAPYQTAEKTDHDSRPAVWEATERCTLRSAPVEQRTGDPCSRPNRLGLSS
jgi:hypothetical protein